MATQATTTKEATEAEVGVNSKHHRISKGKHNHKQDKKIFMASVGNTKIMKGKILTAIRREMKGRVMSSRVKRGAGLINIVRQLTVTPKETSTLFTAQETRMNSKNMLKNFLGKEEDQVLVRNRAPLAKTRLPNFSSRCKRCMSASTRLLKNVLSLRENTGAKLRGGLEAIRNGTRLRTMSIANR